MKKIIFFGTPDFANIVLSTLIKSEKMEVVGVVSNPDAKVGRKQVSTPSPVKQLALENDIPVFTPEKCNDEQFLQALQNLNADIFVVVAYGKLMPQVLLDIPKNGAFNLHFSMLPEYRGASPVQSALLNGDEVSGITIFKLVLAMDAGDIVWQEPFRITGKTTPLCLDQMSEVGAEAFVDIIPNIETMSAVAQDNEKATYCSKITKADGEVSPLLDSAKSILHKWRAFYAWPGVFLFDENGKRIKLLEMNTADTDITNAKIGFFVHEKRLFLQTMDGCIEILKLQKEGKKAVEGRGVLGGIS